MQQIHAWGTPSAFNNHAKIMATIIHVAVFSPGMGTGMLEYIPSYRSQHLTSYFTELRNVC